MTKKSDGYYPAFNQEKIFGRDRGSRTNLSCLIMALKIAVIARESRLPSVWELHKISWKIRERYYLKHNTYRGFDIELEILKYFSPGYDK